METHTKEVYFYLYCVTCAYKNNDAGEDPCDECLRNPYNEDSHKPINYKKEGQN